MAKYNNKIHAIYVLSDPDTGNIRYVGKTCRNPSRIRFNEHIAQAKTGKTHISCWIRSLISNGKKPTFEIIEEVSPGQASEAEMFWIAQFRALGFDLVNHTDGGEGMIGYKLPREKCIAKSRTKGGRPIWDNFGNRYEYTEEAGRMLGIEPDNIRAVLRNKKLSAKGRTFWYEGEPAKELPTKEFRHNQRLKAAACLKKPIKNQYGKEYDSIIAAAKELNLHPPNITNVLNKKNKHTKGYIFRFIEEEMPPFQSKEELIAEGKALTKKVTQRPIIDNFGTIYESITDAAKTLGIGHCGISQVVTGRQKITAEVYSFRYFKDNK